MKKIFIILSGILLLTACQSQFQDLSQTLKANNLLPPVTGEFSDATWVSKHEIFFLKRLEQEDFDHDFLVNPKTTIIMAELYLYNLDSQEWQKIPFSVNPACHVEHVKFMLGLPDRNLGVVTSCSQYMRSTLWDSTREIDPNTYESKVIFWNEIFPYKDIGLIGVFAYSPDMSELVQEDASNYLLGNKLYYISPDKIVTQIVPAFGRAMNPSWSPNERKIAFWGTEDSPKLKTTWDIVGRASEPWNLYVSTPEGTDVKSVLPSISDPGFIKWSPKGEVLAFGGKYKGAEGIWLFNSTSSEIVRIWNKSGDFDWSPDSKKIIIIDTERDPNNNYKVIEQNISILDLP